MTTPGILCVFAHPDDESFGVGGALAGYAMRGTPVDLLCATRGEAGQLGDPPVTTQEGLGAVREAALRDAVRVLGFRDLSLLDHHDGQLSDVPYETLLGEVMEVMRRVRPTTIITFGPYGI
ncbi:MAG TPA: PIG-L family deacetylase [Thermomicrobiales bacterium]